MKLSSIHIQNFRGFKDQSIDFDEYTCFVGPNGSGKSTVLTALNVFFRNTASAATDLVNLQEEDFHLRDVSNPIKITLTFDSLSPQAKDILKAYVRQDKLVVSAIATWNPQSARAEVKQVGSRLVMQELAPYFEAIERKAKADELRSIFVSLAAKFPDLGKPGTLDAMRSALRTFEEKNPEKCQLVEAETLFYGWSKGENLLRNFVQWIYLPAVKDPTTEQSEGRNTALGSLLERTIRSKVDFDKPIAALKEEAASKYKKILEKEQSALDELTKSLTTRLKTWAHEDAKVALLWHYDDLKSISVSPPLARALAGEHEFLGDVGRLGHGLQRAFLVSILQELAESGEQQDTKLLLGFEEPELYQHPPQARHMASVLEMLSQKNSQIVITTHSPYFVSAKGFENIRMVRHDGKSKASTVKHTNFDNLAKLLGKALGEDPRSSSGTMASVEQIMQPSQNELYFSRVSVFVEGVEDVAFLSTYLHLSGNWAEFRRLGCHFIVADGKTSLSRPLAIASSLGIPSFAMFDADGGKKQPEHKRDNMCILRLVNESSCGEFPDKQHFGTRCTVWPNNIRTSVVEEVGQAHWDAADVEVRKRFKYEGVTQKNTVMLSAILEELWARGVRSNLVLRACECVLDHARSTAS